MSAKIIVYSALFADSDVDLKDAGSFCEKTETYEGVEFIAFTNRKDIKSKKWNIKYVELKESSPRLDARYYKTHPHEVLPKHNSSIWIDSQFYITKNPKTIINERLIEQQASVAIHHHGDINNLIREANSQAFIYKNDDPRICLNQLLEYYEDGFPVQQYHHFETGALIRLNNSIAREFNEMWWKEIKRHSLRDQMSCPYVVWKMRQTKAKAIHTIAESFVAHQHTLPIPKSKDFFTVAKPPLTEDISKRKKSL